MFNLTLLPDHRKPLYSYTISKLFLELNYFILFYLTYVTP